MSTATASSSGKKRKEGKTVVCKYCDMSFKKLEHLQRHERTHTLDRPYACDTCSKTFARQDTLHRHSRLHARKDDDAPPLKGPKKRRVSNAGASSPPKSGSEGSPEGSTSSSSASAALPLPVPPANLQGSPSFHGLGLSMSLPVAPPSFPAYSQPEFHSINPAVIPLPRRLSDVSYGTTLPSAHGAASAASAFSSQVAGTAGGGGPGPQRPLTGRPRALTLAGLPESLGCFSLVNSPAPSDADDSSSSSDDEADSDDLKVAGSSASSDGDLGGVSWTDPFAAPESHYPSPAFSDFAPDALQGDGMCHLQAILDNDPVPAAFHQPTPPPTAEPGFDITAFAASIEGPSASKAAEVSPHPSALPATLEELLASAGANSLLGLSVPPPTDAMPAGHLAASESTGLPPLPVFQPPSSTTATGAPFDLAEEIRAFTAEQQAREAAATAALFGNFAFTANPSSPATSASLSSTSLNSSLGLSFGLPTPSPSFFPPVSKYHPPPPPERGLTLPISAPVPPPITVASATASTSEPSAQAAFAALAATYTTTYPTLSLPVAGLDLPNSTSSTSTTSLPAPSSTLPAASAPMGAPSPTSQSLHELLTAAWERKLKAGGAPSPSLAAQTAQLLKSPFAQPAAKSTPAFYIPS
ncbi:hypothetical protein JCM8097_003125 [Rhodosporidiobolus ruineniae]